MTPGRATPGTSRLREHGDDAHRGDDSRGPPPRPRTGPPGPRGWRRGGPERERFRVRWPGPCPGRDADRVARSDGRDQGRTTRGRPGTVRSWPLLLLALPAAVAYAAYALRAWLSAGSAVSARKRRFSRWSAIGSLLLGMAGQVAYHLLEQDRMTHAPWGVTTAVSCSGGRS
jgi:hypothetical protein